MLDTVKTTPQFVLLFGRPWQAHLAPALLRKGRWHKGSWTTEQADFWLTDGSQKNHWKTRRIGAYSRVSLVGAYWFRLGEYARGGMPRMVRWPRKKSDQNITANTELALAA